MNNFNQQRLLSHPYQSKGFAFTFFIDENVIHAGSSLTNGIEVVYVNGKLITKIRSFSKRSIHSIQINDQSYQVVFSTTNMLKGHLTCSLKKNDLVCKSYEGRIRYFSKRKLLLFFVLMVAVFSIFALSVISNLPPLLLFPLFVAVGIAYWKLSFKGYAKNIQYIEVET